MSELRTLTIDRKTWLRGVLPEDRLSGEGGELLSYQGYKCCLGFDALACGVPEEFLLKVPGPSTLIKSHQEFSDILAHQFTRLQHDDPGYSTAHRWWMEAAMDINDSIYFKEEERETLLKKLFLKVNVQLEFIN